MKSLAWNFNRCFEPEGTETSSPSLFGSPPAYRTHFLTYNVQEETTEILFTVEGEWHAPNWTADGVYLVCDMGFELYRIPVSGENKGNPEKIYRNPTLLATNDHALSWDGKQIAVTCIGLPLPENILSVGDIRNPILVMNIDGSEAQEIYRGWLHGWAPDGQHLVYTHHLGEKAHIYRVGAEGNGALQMTSINALDDGPEYSADGKWVYFCSNRSGTWDTWRMPADGAGPDDRLAEKITDSAETQDWFPHISPDGKWLYTISYPKDHPEHEYVGEGVQIKLLRLEIGVGAKGAELTTVRTLYGGQGSGNTGGWAPELDEIRLDRVRDDSKAC